MVSVLTPKTTFLSHIWVVCGFNTQFPAAADPWQAAVTAHVPWLLTSMWESWTGLLGPAAPQPPCTSEEWPLGWAPSPNLLLRAAKSSHSRSQSEWSKSSTQFIYWKGHYSCSSLMIHLYHVKGVCNQIMNTKKCCANSSCCPHIPRDHRTNFSRSYPGMLQAALATDFQMFVIPCTGSNSQLKSEIETNDWPRMSRAFVSLLAIERMVRLFNVWRVNFRFFIIWHLEVCWRNSKFLLGSFILFENLHSFMTSLKKPLNHISLK